MMSATWSDEQILDVMDRHERCGESTTAIAMSYGKTRNTTLGLIFRVRKAQAGHNDDKVVKPENRDGGMPARWWDRVDDELG